MAFLRLLLFIFGISISTCTLTPAEYNALLSIDSQLGTGFNSTYGLPQTSCNCSPTCSWVSNLPGNHVSFSCSGGLLTSLLITTIPIATALPSEIGSLVNLNTLALRSQNLTGQIPASFSNLTSLTAILITQTNLTGGISVFNGLTNLTSFSVSSNSYFTTGLPNLVTLTSLTSFYYHNNNLLNSNPSVSCPSCTVLDLSFSGLTGNLGFLAGFPALVNLNLAGNSLTGNLSVLAGLGSLQILSVASNSLIGNLSTLPLSLQRIDVSSNSLSGDISRLTNMNLTYLNLAGDPFSGAIPATLADLLSGSCLLDNTLLNGCQGGTIYNCSISCLATTVPATTLGCQGSAPTGATCVSGNWVYPGNLNVTSPVTISSPVFISGDITLDNSSVLVLGTGGYITVNGTAVISGTLRINGTAGQNVPVLTASNITGQFGKIITSDACTQGVQQNTGTDLSVLFVDQGCSVGLSRGALIGIIVGSIIGGMLVLFLVIWLAYRFRIALPLLGPIFDEEEGIK